MPRKSDVDPNFMRQIEALQAQAAAETAARARSQPVPTLQPVANGWSGSPFDLAGMRLPFDRSGPNQAQIDSLKSSDDPGSVGDVVATSTQIDFLSGMERAFRARHGSGFCRVVAHSLGRKAFHGSNLGPFKQGVLDYVSEVLKQS